MFMLGKKLSGLLLVLAAAMPLGCGSSHEGPRDREVKVGGDYGVVVERSDSGTEVKIGGDHGIVVDHPRD